MKRITYIGGVKSSAYLTPGYKRLPNNPDSECIVGGCTRLSHARGLCQNHYWRFKKYGNPEMPPQRNKRWLYRDYMHVTVNGKPMLEHRYVMEQKLGRKLLSSEVVHHIDGDKTNNSAENLQLFDSHSKHNTKYIHGEHECLFCHKRPQARQMCGQHYQIWLKKYKGIIHIPLLPHVHHQHM